MVFNKIYIEQNVYGKGIRKRIRSCVQYFVECTIVVWHNSFYNPSLYSYIFESQIFFKIRCISQLYTSPLFNRIKIRGLIWLYGNINNNMKHQFLLRINWTNIFSKISLLFIYIFSIHIFPSITWMLQLCSTAKTSPNPDFTHITLPNVTLCRNSVLWVTYYLA